MRVAIITANTDIYKGTKANESGGSSEACGRRSWT